MADTKITGLNELTTPALEDLLAIVDDPSGSEETKKVTLTNLLSAIILPSEGQVWNGQIVVSVATNHLTVALKGIDGNDPSATNPVRVQIGGTVRTCTAALSKTLVDDANYFNAGGAELATQAVQYFVYLIWNTTPATDIVDLGFARVPYANAYGDLSATTTNQNYFATANGSAPQATDQCVVIGRFTATLSAGAAYDWTISGTGDVINRPIFETDQLLFAPQGSAKAPMGWAAVVTEQFYVVKYNMCFFSIKGLASTTGTASDTLYLTAPFITTVRGNHQFSCLTTDAAQMAGSSFISTTTNAISIKKYDQSNYGIGASRAAWVNGSYPI